MRSILKQVGHQEENLPPPSKKVKADHGEIMQKISDVYTSRGHYLPYGSVNTSSTSYTKNIQTNKYPLCMRRFSGYKRSCFTALNPVNSLPATPTKPPAPPVVGIHTIPAQASEKVKLTSTPMLSSLLDEKEGQSVDIKPTAHPLVFEPAQGATPQQYQASTLTDLLEGPEGLNNNASDKKSKKVRQKRRTSESAPLTSVAPTAVTAPARKRKKSDNEEIVRELTSKVKSEVSEQALAASHIISQPRIALSDFAVSSSSHSSSLGGKSTSSRPSSSNSHLVQLLHNIDDEKRSKQSTKTKVVTVDVGDIFESAQHMKDEALHAEVKGPTSVTIKTMRAKKSTDDKKVVKQSASADAVARDRKMKRSDSVEMKMKETRSVDQMPSPPGKKTAKVATSKSKAKAQPKQEPVSALTIRTFEDRASPKEKVKKQSSEKDKKKKAQKSPVTTDAAARQSIPLSNFYGGNSKLIKSMPKIPKRKQGEGQASPTSPKPSLQQKSPVQFMEWQRSSPVLNRSLPAKAEEIVAGNINRTKSYPPPGDPAGNTKRPALLPTPGAQPSVATSGQRTAHRKVSVTDKVHKQSQSSSTAQVSQPSRYSTGSGNKGRGVEPSPNSPDELSIVLESHPVRIPTQPVGNDPTSPVPEIVTQAPKAIPLDPNKPGLSNTTHKSILVKQKAVSRPLTFSPKSTADGRLDDDLMNVALNV